MTRLQKRRSPTMSSTSSYSEHSNETSEISQSTRPSDSGNSPPTTVSSFPPSPTTALPSPWPTRWPGQFGEEFDHQAQSCEFNADAYFPEDIGESDGKLSSADLGKAADLPIYDSKGRPRPFKSLYSGDGVVGRQLVIFVRHFYCGACQAYLQYLTKHITPEAYFTLPVPTSIAIIGCGQPEIINKYARLANCPFPIYADPSRRLYKALGMSWSLKVGRRPEYMQINAANLAISSLAEIARSERKLMFKGGPFTQIGGEFMFEDGECIWGHRMRNVRDHTDIATLRKVLEMDYEEPVVGEAKPMSMSSSPQSSLKLIISKAKTTSKSNLKEKEKKGPERQESQYIPDCLCQMCLTHQPAAKEAKV